MGAMETRAPHRREPGKRHTPERGSVHVIERVPCSEHMDSQGIMFQCNHVRFCTHAIWDALGPQELARLVREEETVLRLVEVRTLSFGNSAVLGDDLDVSAELLAEGALTDVAPGTLVFHCTIRPGGTSDAPLSEAILCVRFFDSLGPTEIPDAFEDFARAPADLVMPLCKRRNFPWKPLPAGTKAVPYRYPFYVYNDSVDSTGALGFAAVINTFERARVYATCGHPSGLRALEDTKVMFVIGRFDHFDFSACGDVHFGEELEARVWVEGVTDALTRTHQSIYRKSDPDGAPVATGVVTTMCVDSQFKMTPIPDTSSVYDAKQHNI